MKKYAMIGGAGYIAPRHMRAIQETGGELVAVCDKSDSIGILDSHFPNAEFFLNEYDLETYLEHNKVDYLVVCTPNYLHGKHIRLGLRCGANVICEKPLTIDIDNLNRLEDCEKETGKKINTILQLRLHEKIVELKNKIWAEERQKVAKDPTAIYKRRKVDLTYIAPRGKWYDKSWKGNPELSGGMMFNIGVHFFDMLTWFFGDPVESKIYEQVDDVMIGQIAFKSADVNWLLSTNQRHLPKEISAKGQKTYRNLSIDGKEIEFSEGFTNLHTKSYEEILKGNGFGIKHVRSSIELIQNTLK